jgi:hypothetical protein
VLQSLDDSFNDFARVGAVLKAQWTAEAQGEDIVIDDLEVRIQTSWRPAITTAVPVSEIPVRVSVLEPPFSVLDCRHGVRNKLLLRASPAATLAAGLTDPSKGSEVARLVPEVDFAIVFPGGAGIGVFAFVEDGSLAEFPIGTRCEIWKLADSRFDPILTIGPSIYWKPARLDVNLTYAKAEAVLRKRSIPAALARGPEIKRLHEADAADRIILTGRTVMPYKLSARASHRWWFRFKTDWLSEDAGIKTEALDVTDSPEVKSIVDALTSPWPTFKNDAPAVHESMIAAAGRGATCDRDSQTCLLVELAVPDLKYAFRLPHGQVLTFTLPGSTTIRDMRERFER